MFGVAALRAGPYPGQSASDPLADERMGTMAEPDAPGVPRMVRGTVVTHRRRCGKPGCRCAAGEQLHESVVLSYSERGRTRVVMLPPGEVAAVAAAAERYRAEKTRLERLGAGRLAALDAGPGPGPQAGGA